MSESQNPKRILCVWFPEWPIQRLVIERPELRRQRVILYWHHPQRGQLVAAVSPRAQQDGICKKMPLSEAKALAQASDCHGDLFCELHHPEADKVELIQLALTCERFSPLIGVEQNLAQKRGGQNLGGQSRGGQNGNGPSCIFLDISGLGHLFGNEDALLNQVHSYFDSSGYHVRLGVAATMGMAWALARFPNHTLQTLPVEALRVSNATLDTLHQLGLQSVGQLLNLPRAAMKTRLGETLCNRLDQLTGAQEEVFNSLRRPAEHSVNQFLEYPLTHRETVVIIIERLVSQLCRELHAKQRGAIQWQIELAGPERLPLRIDVNLFQASATARHVMQIFKMQMENCSNNHNSERSQIVGRHCAVQDITVSVLRSVLLTERQRELFDENPRLDRQAFAQLINRLASRLGSQNVLQPRLQAGAQAEFASRLVPLVGPGADHESMNISSETRRTVQKLKRSQKNRRGKPGKSVRQYKQFFALDRPLRLYDSPMQLKAVSVFDGRPALLIGKQKSLKVVRTWGPERVESGWWRGPTVRRDYWRVETDGGRWLWVYRDLQNRNWFLHGEF